MTKAEVLQLKKDYVREHHEEPQSIDFTPADWIDLLNWPEFKGIVAVDGLDALKRQGVLGLKVGRTDAPVTRVY